MTILSTLVSVLSEISDYAAERDSRSATTNALLVDIKGELGGIANAIKSKSCDGCGTELDPPPGSNPGDPQTDPTPTDPDFPDWQTFEDYKCKAANYLADYWEKWMFDASIRDWDALSVGVLSVVVQEVIAISVGAGVVVAGVVISSGILVVAGLAIAIAAFIIGGSAVDFADMGTAIQIHKEDVICAMYNASDAAQARADVMQVLIDAGLTVPEREIAELVITNRDLNKLFERDSDLDNSPYVPPYDCSCGESAAIPLPIVIDSCQLQGTWRYGHPSTLNNSPITTGLIDDGVECPGTPAVGWNHGGRDALETGAGSSNARGFVFTPTANGQITIDIGAYGSSPQALTFHVYSEGVQLHTQQTGLGGNPGSSWFTVQYSFVFQAGVEYYVSWSHGNTIWALSNGSFA